MQLQFVGSGDAFGSGGRFNTCFHVIGERTNFLIDCGATALVAMNRWQIDRDAIDIVVLSHFHADHFGGIPFFILDAQFVTRRIRPLTIAGPRGLREWFARAMDTAFPGSAATTQRFPIDFIEMEVGQRTQVGPLAVTTFQAIHDERAGPCLALRIEAEDRVITYSGDTEWTPGLIEAARDADLFVCEAYMRDSLVRGKPVKMHMSVAALEENRPAITAKRIVLTHMSNDVLPRRDEVPFDTAEDGMVVTL